MSNDNEKQSKLDKYLYFSIQSHGNHGKEFFHSYECQGIQNKFDKKFNLSFNLGPLKVNSYGVEVMIHILLLIGKLSKKM